MGNRCVELVGAVSQSVDGSFSPYPVAVAVRGGGTGDESLAGGNECDRVGVPNWFTANRSRSRTVRQSISFPYNSKMSAPQSRIFAIAWLKLSLAATSTPTCNAEKANHR